MEEDAGVDVQKEMKSSQRIQISDTKSQTGTGALQEVGELKMATSKFDVSGIDNDIVRKYKPEFLAYGGQHVVYRLPSYPRHVVKVEGSSVIELLEGNLIEGYVPKEAEVQEKLSEANGRFEQLRAIFGREHTLSQTKHFLEVPVNQTVLSEIYLRYGEPRAHTMPVEVQQFTGDKVNALVTMQELAPELKDGRILFPVQSGYAEQIQVDGNEELKGAYDRVTTKTFLDSSADFRLDDFLVVHPEMKQLIEQASKDDHLKELLEDFTLKAIKYSQVTGDTLDFKGDDNVVFFKEDGRWNYKLIDAMWPGPPPAEGKINLAQQVAQKVATEGPSSLSLNERNSLMATLNYVRVINGLTNWLGSEKRIAVLSEESPKPRPEELYQAITSSYHKI